MINHLNVDFRKKKHDCKMKVIQGRETKKNVQNIAVLNRIITVTVNRCGF